MISQRFKVFLASPSDVDLERRHILEVIEDYNQRVADNLGVRIEVLRWEDASPDLGDPQDLINQRAESADLVVVVFWRRLGTPTRQHESGTLEEFENARKRWVDHGRPDVWVYFRDLDDTLMKDPGQQLAKLLDFRTRFEKQRLGLSVAYPDPATFRYLFQSHLYQRIIEAVLPSERDGAVKRRDLGVIRVVSKVARQDLRMLSGLRYYSSSRDEEATFEEPVVINPSDAPVDVYADGLSLVKERFWTTAFLDSVYWDGGHPAVLDANSRMLERIRMNKGTARRLLVGSQEPTEEARSLISYVHYLKEHGRTEEVQDRLRGFDYLQHAMTELDASGFETRVGTDAALLYQRLPLQIDGKCFSPYKFGLTIYDDVRVDVFREGKFGLTGSVHCFTPATSHFKIVLDKTHEYFAELWKRAVPFSEFLAALDAARAELGFQ